MMNLGFPDYDYGQPFQTANFELNDERPTTSSSNRILNNNNMDEWANGAGDEMENLEHHRETESNDNGGLPREMIFKKIKRMYIGKSSKECTICFNIYNRGELIRRLPCKHIFHEGCVIPWLAKNHKCPNCRFDIKEYFSEMENKEN